MELCNYFVIEFVLWNVYGILIEWVSRQHTDSYFHIVLLNSHKICNRVISYRIVSVDLDLLII